MLPLRRLWDSCVVIGFLAGYEEIKQDCELIIQDAERGRIEIAISQITKVETAFLPGIGDTESESLIKEFFGRDYIIPISVDDPVSTISRDLVRRYPGLKPPDAIQFASAILWRIPIIETTDPDLIGLNEREGTPPIAIRKPLYEGTRPLFT